MTAPLLPDTVHQALKEASIRRVQADRDRAAAMLDIAAWLAKGRDAGVPISHMAETTNLSRRTCYDLLGD